MKHMNILPTRGWMQATFIAMLLLVTNWACAETLDIYFIDVEGGQATLVITPGGESLLIDAGFPGEGAFASLPGDVEKARDAQRIVAAARDAGISRIDFLLITHFHSDHFGGVTELSQLIPITTYIDNDTPTNAQLKYPIDPRLLDSYYTVRSKGKHMVPAPGNRLSLEGVELTVVSTMGSVLESPLSGAGEPNPACDRPLVSAGEPHENPRSIGIRLQYGDFSFLDLGDLVGPPLSDLVCPTNLTGAVDVYLVTHHGDEDAADPATLAAFQPRVAILNNGPTKGGAGLMFSVLQKDPIIEDVWQLHHSENEGVENFPQEFIANLNRETAFWIKLSARQDGSFRMLNGRTGVWTDYDKK